MSGSVSLALLLLAGHLAGDFVVQTARVAGGKHRPGLLLLHGLVSYLVAGALLWPFWSGRMFLTLLAAMAIHLVIDGLKARSRPTVTAFLADQAAHLTVLAALWSHLAPYGYAGPAGGMAPGPWFGWYVWAAVMVGLMGFNLKGGSALVRLALDPSLLTAEEGTPAPNRGQVIGYLERILVVALVMVGQWALIGLVLAAKSLARFKDLDNRDFAEYYLIGTLTSLLVGVATGLVASWAMVLCRLGS